MTTAMAGIDENDLSALDLVEAAAWWLAAEPIPARMDNLLAVVSEHAATIAAATARGSQDAVEASAGTYPSTDTGTGTKLGQDATRLHQDVLHAASDVPKRTESVPVTTANERGDVRALPEWKICSRCKQSKRREEYGKDSSSATGMRSRCKTCEKYARAAKG